MAARADPHAHFPTEAMLFAAALRFMPNVCR